MSTTISVEHVSKTYRLGMISGATLQEDLSRWWAKVRHKPDPLLKVGQEHHARLIGQKFWALDDVSFTVAQGEVLGIIGRNGAGKSTLLKILSQVTAPTSGRIRIKGRVASLLEVGTGFHPELTGRENIFLNGAIMGMTKAEIRRKLDEIIAFSEIEEFIDTPVKRYSSGMYVRLAFAVAAHLEPEILIVDEVLAVGDAAFQKKCMGKMNESKGQGRTVLFVSHNMQAVQQLCATAIYLKAGRMFQEGPTTEVVQNYLQDIPSGESLAAVAEVIAQLPPDQVFRLRSVDVMQGGRSDTNVISGNPIDITISYDVRQTVSGFHVYFLLYDSDGLMLFESINNGDEDGMSTYSPGHYVSRATIPGDFLAGRMYVVQINAAIANVRTCIPQPSPVRIRLSVTGFGRVNRAYPGYVTPGKIAPLIPWQTEAVTEEKRPHELGQPAK
jgi:lipopolysaccharide transport system ATP-binding protein